MGGISLEALPRRPRNILPKAMWRPSFEGSRWLLRRRDSSGVMQFGWMLFETTCEVKAICRIQYVEFLRLMGDSLWIRQAVCSVAGPRRKRMNPNFKEREAGRRGPGFRPPARDPAGRGPPT